MDKKVYFAAPLFNAAEKGFNLKLTEMLENAGYSVFLPQRDGNEAALMSDMTEGEKSAAIFCADKDALMDADILFMVIDGRVPDEGACVELGMAYASGKRCYGIRTDVRCAEHGLDINPMLTGCLIEVFRSEEDLAKHLACSEL